MTNDSTPDLDDIQQYEEPEPMLEVPVRITNSDPIQVHILPARGAVMRGITVPTDSMQQLVGGNKRRKSMCVWATGPVTGGSLFIGVNLNEVEMGTCAILPIIVDDGSSPFKIEMTHTMPVWVRNASGNTITVSFVTEDWAD